MYSWMSDSTVVLKWMKRLMYIGFVVGCFSHHKGINWFTQDWYAPFLVLFIHEALITFALNIHAFAKAGCFMEECYGEDTAVLLFFVIGALAGIVSCLWNYGNIYCTSVYSGLGCGGVVCGWIGYMLYDIKQIPYTGKLILMKIGVLVLLGEIYRMVTIGGANTSLIAGLVIGFLIHLCLERTGVKNGKVYQTAMCQYKKVKGKIEKVFDFLSDMWEA